MPFFVIAIAIVGLLVTYPFQFLASVTVIYLILIPLGASRYRALEQAQKAAHPVN